MDLDIIVKQFSQVQHELVESSDLENHPCTVLVIPYYRVKPNSDQILITPRPQAHYKIDVVDKKNFVLFSPQRSTRSKFNTCLRETCGERLLDWQFGRNTSSSIQ